MSDERSERGVAKRWRRAWRSQRGAGVTAFVLAALLALMALGAADRDAHLGPDAPTAQATVVDIVPRYRNTDIVVTFTTADGRQVRAQTDEYLGQREIGDVLTVSYSAEDPEVYVRERGTPSLRIFVVGLSAAAALFVLGGMRGFRGTLPDWLLNR